jgi:hypothetical protein
MIDSPKNVTSSRCVMPQLKRRSSMRTSLFLVAGGLFSCILMACSAGTKETSSGGEGGEGGSTGPSGSTGPGGSTTSGGASLPDPPGPKDPEAALRAAVFVGSCLPDDGINRTLNRYYTRKGGADSDHEVHERTQCFKSKANGCAAVQECLGYTADLSGPCEPGCLGDVFSACDDQLKFTVNCGRLGLSCSTEHEECVKKPLGAACDDETYTTSCEGGAPKVCLSVGETLGPTCADYDLTCGTGALSEEAACIGKGASCMEEVGSSTSIYFDQGGTCSGDTLTTCVNGGEHALDCKSLATGFTCQSTGTSSFCGLDAACDPNAGLDATCDGDSVVVCNGGRVEKVDCKSLGFTGCSPMFGVCIPSVYSAF